MPQPWIKMHIDVLDNPKVTSLDPTDFRLWVLTLLVGRRINEDGRLPALNKLAHMLQVHPKWLDVHIEKLIAANLIERRDDALAVHDWDEWQRGYPSDMRAAVAERVSRHRASKRADDAVTSSNESPVVTEHVTSVTSLEEKREEKKRREKKETPASAGETRATRIPADFALSDAMGEYAVSKGVSVERAREHAEEFRLYWHGATKNATHRDWVSRWQSRVLRDIRDGHLVPDIRPASAEPSPASVPTPAERTFYEMRSVLDGEKPTDAATRETLAVVDVLGGWAAINPTKRPTFSAWLGAWNVVHGSA